MKKILSLFIFSLAFILCSSNSVKAQFSDLKGLTILALNSTFLEEGKEVTEKVDQVFNFSFTDKILAHTIFVNGYVDNSQIYELRDIKNFVEGEITNFKCTAHSGISGSLYDYHIKLDIEGKLIDVVISQEDEVYTTMTGDVQILRTYKQ